MVETHAVCHILQYMLNMLIILAIELSRESSRLSQILKSSSLSDKKVVCKLGFYMCAGPRKKYVDVMIIINDCHQDIEELLLF